MKHTINVPVTVDVPDVTLRADRSWTGNTGLYLNIYAPRPGDIRFHGPDGHGGMSITLTNGIHLEVGDDRFIGDGSGRYGEYGTLAEQAEAMRLLQKHAGEIADELERRVQAQQPAQAPERVASPAEVEEDRARHQRAREATAAAGGAR